MTNTESSIAFKAHLYHSSVQSSDSPAIPQLSLNDNNGTKSELVCCAVNIAYVTEGAANVIWSFDPAVPKDQIPSVLLTFVEDRLLRLRKGTSPKPGHSNAHKPPPYVSTADVHEHFHSTIAPLFERNQIIQQDKICISPEIVTRCNQILDYLESDNRRHQKRHGWHIDANDPHGLLITSMYPTTPNTVLFHMKPKWLVQSPTAPIGARRCRTCALQADRGSSTAHATCPLGLISENQDTVQRQIAKLDLTALSLMGTPLLQNSHSVSKTNLQVKISDTDHRIKSLASVLVSSALPGGQIHSVLQRLRELQQKLDPRGIYDLFHPGHDGVSVERATRSSDQDVDDLAMAMTLRDTTMFVRLTQDDKGTEDIEVRLADLDPKKAELEKLKYWWSIEDKLIQGGWYTGREKRTEVEKQHDSCYLWLQEK